LRATGRGNAFASKPFRVPPLPSPDGFAKLWQKPSKFAEHWQNALDTRIGVEAALREAEAPQATGRTALCQCLAKQRAFCRTLAKCPGRAGWGAGYAA
jgi:hypothetical protein